MSSVKLAVGKLSGCDNAGPIVVPLHRRPNSPDGHNLVRSHGNSRNTGIRKADSKSFEVRNHSLEEEFDLQRAITLSSFPSTEILDLRDGIFHVVFSSVLV